MTATAPFAAVQASINAGVSELLANALATWEGGEAFGVIFERGPVMVLGDVGGHAPRASLPIGQVPGVRQGSVIVIGGVSYEVVGAVEPDESGWLNDLQLREA